MRRRAGAVAQAHVRRDVLGEDAAHLLVLGGELVGVALEESGQERRHHRREELGGLGRVAIEPFQAGELGRLPAGGVQPGHPVEHGRRNVGRAGGDLVTLSRAGDVLHEEREPSGVWLDLGGVHGGQPGGDAGGDLAVEAHLYLVSPEREPGGPALLVGRGELPHDAGRPAAGPVVGRGETRRVRHLAGADRRVSNDVTLPPSSSRRFAARRR